MTLLLTLERSPQPQAVRQMRLDKGALVIGRAAEADWRIDDPDMYVSRAHCTVSGGPDAFTVTDTSSGGLYLDGASTPLGAGNSASLHDGMRLRLGDYVVRVELAQTTTAAPSPPGAVSRLAPARGNGYDADGFFSATLDTPQPEPRPKDLPDPFERPVSTDRMQAERARPPLFDDPFTLDPAPSRPPEPGGFGWDTPETPPEKPSAPAGSFDWDAPAESQRSEPFPKREWQTGPAGFDWDTPAPEPPIRTRPEPSTQPEAARSPAPPHAAPAPATEPAREAFLRGLGLDPADYSDADMEALGRAHRMMIEGLMHLLRKRAEEKAGARIAQTVVGGSEVNPLKFMPTADDALATLLGRRSPGFLDGEAAIVGAIRDLAQHHVSAWRGIQGALARMLDRFDPKALEAELKELSRIETLLAGGRRAKLWELYEERYREIAKSAESRFLGELGADFRDAYERRGD